ncbi:MAG TPA: ABC transporter permease [Anaerolineaceae bacterium]|nr:ABC transporter permease [Anaerolineaceae bacterium]HNZ01286.1 ABC transporter permease [Anaerolineaceae bacterium]HOH20728.1 ABC transporter permease [Anaerolineaceae bacterium]HOU44691.1 ABC transporter permease [Anaerolineaceae bacterium]HPA33520.1 ABC transporter permease [Anaerolineaceae bacterium]
MIKYIIKRLIMMIPVMLGITLLVFTIMSLSPGDPGTLILGPMATQEEIDAKNQELGFYDPFFVKYFDFVINAVQGDLGTSWYNNQPVTREIMNRFPVTFKLTIYSILLTVIVSIPLGTIAALKQYSIIDNVSMLLALFLASMPVFWLGLMLIIIFALNLDILPATGNENWKNFILPTIALAGSVIAVISRMTRVTMIEVLHMDYIRTARAKGATEGRVVRKHAIQNTLIPVVTVLGVNLGIMLGGTVLIEQVFGMAGIGTLMINAIRTKDIPLVMGSVTFLALCFSIINLLVDISYGFIDPRIKTE